MSKIKFLEEHMHTLLSTWLYDSYGIYTKTIRESESTNKELGLNQWVHPDMFGVKFSQPEEDTDSQIILTQRNTNPTPKYRLYSYELKYEITLSNLKEYYFQAVANSSWANEGYLVTCKIHKKAEEELERLSKSHNIGVILLNRFNLNESKILHKTKNKDEVDKYTLEKFLKLNNTRIDRFLEYINLYVGANEKTKKWFREEFDKIMDNKEVKIYMDKFQDDTSMLECEITTEEKFEEEVSQQIELTIHESWTGFRPSSFVFEGTEYKATTTTDVLKKITTMLYERLGSDLVKAYESTDLQCNRKELFLNDSSVGYKIVGCNGNSDVYIKTKDTNSEVKREQIIRLLLASKTKENEFKLLGKKKNM